MERMPLIDSSLDRDPNKHIQCIGMVMCFLCLVLSAGMTAGIVIICNHSGIKCAI